MEEETQLMGGDSARVDEKRAGNRGRNLVFRSNLVRDSKYTAREGGTHFKKVFSPGVIET